MELHDDLSKISWLPVSGEFLLSYLPDRPDEVRKVGGRYRGETERTYLAGQLLGACVKRLPTLTPSLKFFS